MQVTVTAKSDTTCELLEVTPATSCPFTVPLSKSTLIAALREILTDPERRDLGAASVLIERMRDGLRVHHGSGSFLIRYQHVFPLILSDA